jgi:hypothetical protein
MEIDTSKLIHEGLGRLTARGRQLERNADRQRSGQRPIQYSNA